jgi:hypothetical protein
MLRSDQNFSHFRIIQELGEGGSYGEPVPGTHVLAVVAPEDPVADQGSQRTGNRAAELNCEIGNASTCIHDIGSHYGAGQAKPAAHGAAHL